MSHDTGIRTLGQEPPQPTSFSTRRCAIYARVSVSSPETGLNSLQAQVQACEAYIQSQRDTGWELVAPAYIDDGYSGGNLDRPAMGQLIKDLKTGKFDAVVVQRLDRLSRSIKDICDLLITFNSTNTAVVSITQTLDTATPTGRLTLHLLTTFSQFEREIAGERTRDKFAITRSSGRWQRNGIPLGYVLNNQQELQIHASEAAMARDIFERFLSADSMAALIEDLNALGYRTKLHISLNGNRHGGKPFDRNTLNQLLRNRAYIGEVFYGDEWHPGHHEPIIDRALWDQVQAIRSDRARRTGIPSSKIDDRNFPLEGQVFWHDGRAYTTFESSLRGNGRRYRYYKAPARSKEDASSPVTLSTAQLHRLVIDYLMACFEDPRPWLENLSDEWKSKPEFDPTHVKRCLHMMHTVRQYFMVPLISELFKHLIERVIVYPNQVQVVLNLLGLSELLQSFKPIAASLSKPLTRPQKPVKKLEDVSKRVRR